MIGGVLFYRYTFPAPTAGPLKVARKQGASGQSEYVIIHKQNAKLDFEINRPAKTDTNILLCVAGAFTSLDDYTIDGLYIYKGKVINHDKVNHHLGGGVKIENGNCTIFSTGYGKKLTDSLIDAIAANKGSFFQQIRMIDELGSAHFVDSTLTPRRGIAMFKNNDIAIVESLAPVSLGTFANDVRAMGGESLIYTDMGGWDEGWYQDPITGKLADLGSSHSATSKQSNWVVFRK